MSSWSLIQLAPLFEDMPILKPLFVLFYVYSGWALLAVMTGVVSENMIAIRDELAREDQMKEESRRLLAADVLIELFATADGDGSGEVSKAEFEELLKDKDMMK